MTGTPATYISGFIPMAGAAWHRLTGDPSALELGRGLALYLYRHGEMLNPNTGFPTVVDHPGHLTKSILSNLTYALVVGDQEMIKWGKTGFEHLVKLWDPDHTGIIFGKVPCVLSHMIATGILLSQAGEGDYWEEVDRWVRNSLINCQLQAADMEKTKALPTDYKTDLGPNVIQPDDATERCIGTWCHGLTERLRSIGCCNGNASITLHYIWDNIVTADDEELRVNLLMNRASPWADVDSYLPYEGKVAVELKTDQKDLFIRIPKWTHWNKVSCSVNGQSHEYQWRKGYIAVGAVKAGDEIVVEFPMKRRVLSSAFPAVFHQAVFSPGEAYQVTLKGNTAVDLTPDLGYPVGNHAQYRADTAPLKQVRRFVSRERFIW